VRHRDIAQRGNPHSALAQAGERQHGLAHRLINLIELGQQGGWLAAPAISRTLPCRPINPHRCPNRLYEVDRTGGVVGR